jgi:hypothetical protein
MNNEKSKSKGKSSIDGLIDNIDQIHYIEAPLNWNNPMHDRSLDLQIDNSVVLVPRHSMEYCFPIPKSMLSRSEGAFHS